MRNQTAAVRPCGEELQRSLRGKDWITAIMGCLYLQSYPPVQTLQSDWRVLNEAPRLQGCSQLSSFSVWLSHSDRTRRTAGGTNNWRIFFIFSGAALVGEELCCSRSSSIHTDDFKGAETQKKKSSSRFPCDTSDKDSLTKFCSDHADPERITEETDFNTWRQKTCCLWITSDVRVTTLQVQLLPHKSWESLPTTKENKR